MSALAALQAQTGNSPLRAESQQTLHSRQILMCVEDVLALVCPVAFWFNSKMQRVTPGANAARAV